jgi:hypothetical protein
MKNIIALALVTLALFLSTGCAASKCGCGKPHSEASSCEHHKAEGAKKSCTDCGGGCGK